MAKAHSQSAAKTGTLIRGDGPMSAEIRNYPWPDSPLGPIESWPPELLVSVNSMLTSKQMACLIWGEADQIFFYNDLYRPLLGDKSPTLGGNFLTVWNEIREQAEALVVDLFKTKEASLSERVLFRILVNGEFVEKICTLANNPIWSISRGDAQVLGICQTVEDHTAAVHGEASLLETKRQLQQVLNATTDAVFSLDREWNFTYLNGNAKRLLSAYGQLIGRNLWEAFPDATYENSPFIREYTRSMNEGLPGEFETCYPEPEGWFQVLSRPSPDGITVFFRDITADKKAADALIESEKLAAVGRLAASIAHEINNPLEAVTNLIYIAKTSDSVEEIREQLGHADGELRRMAAITNQTLRFHKQASNPTENAPISLLESVITIYQGRLTAASIIVEKRARGSQKISCFEGEIRQVLSNLVGNAIDAMSTTEKRLRLRVRDGREWLTGRKGVVFTVADSGSGMSAATVARVFEAFYTTKGFTGTGLGLWVSKEIVDRHSGRLHVRSTQRKGKSGTVFSLFLPSDAVSRR